MRRLILFLIRLKLGVKKYERFRFTNQKERCKYWFTSTHLLKRTKTGHIEQSGVSLNWLLDKNCKIEKLVCSIYL